MVFVSFTSYDWLIYTSPGIQFPPHSAASSPLQVPLSLFFSGQVCCSVTYVCCLATHSYYCCWCPRLIFLGLLSDSGPITFPQDFLTETMGVGSVGWNPVGPQKSQGRT